MRNLLLNILNEKQIKSLFRIAKGGTSLIFILIRQNMTIYKLIVCYYYLEILHLSTNYYCIFSFRNVKYSDVNI